MVRRVDGVGGSGVGGYSVVWVGERNLLRGWLWLWANDGGYGGL